eukprot:Gregarina_sp_Poly_1__7304@NODE_4010_length_780_cov_4_099579_g2607_i0_p1_GENE_NODE_4010_length_780_cov_4_099579_g2607_i0NODE_4010_length_780_cov_4_099579_g2607_i0_p1_ORF_typecomplete_len115_score15_41DUF805/PF05656_14/0_13_NODE_4010_length_780_cov_4_099579_g2607_i0284628
MTSTKRLTFWIMFAFELLQTGLMGVAPILLQKFSLMTPSIIVELSRSENAIARGFTETNHVVMATAIAAPVVQFILTIAIAACARRQLFTPLRPREQPVDDLMNVTEQTPLVPA